MVEVIGLGAIGHWKKLAEDVATECSDFFGGIWLFLGLQATGVKKNNHHKCSSYILMFEWSQHSSCGRRCKQGQWNKVFVIVRLVLQKSSPITALSSKLENHGNKWWLFRVLQIHCSSKRFPKVRKSDFARLDKHHETLQSLARWDFWGRPAPPTLIEGPVDQQYQQFAIFVIVINCHRLESLPLKENWLEQHFETNKIEVLRHFKIFQKHCKTLTQPKSPWNEI